MYVSDYMSQPVAVSADQDYGAAFRMMRERGWEHVPITDHHNEVVGMLSRRKAELAAYRFQTAPVEVSELIEGDTVYVADSEPLSKAAEQMALHHIDAMLVRDATGRVIGILSDADLHRALVDVLRANAKLAAAEQSVA